ncbi:hypothetical protein AGMMS49992_21920 [Clostridia bacterium]|nr:hypothetical protein AGMMS49992_21920 [Clostridia bacterium]
MEPFTLLIADDEEPILTGLTSFFAINDLGYRVVGCYEDGEGVIDALQHSPVDAVSLDINMRVSGLTVAEYIFKHKLPTKVVILSGYQEFEYAQKAIEYGVTAYLIKPLKHTELIETFTKLHRQIEREKSDTHRIGLERERIDRMLPMLREQFFGSITQHVFFRAQDMDDELRSLDIPQGMPLAFVRLGCDETEAACFAYGRDRLKLAALNFLRENPRLMVYQHTADDSVMEYILFDNTADDTETLRSDAVAWIREACGLIRQNIGVTARMLSLQVFPSCFALYQAVRGRPTSEQTLNDTEQEARARRAVREAVAYMDQNFARPIHLADIAKQARLSPAYFGRVFKQLMGRGVLEHLSRRRVAAACALLSGTLDQIQDVSAQVGYENPKYFIRQFKQVTGLSPTAYRARSRVELP